jgi:hypothetical protein
MLEGIVLVIDEQIGKLQQARALLTGGSTGSPGRPKGLATGGSKWGAPKRRKMSAAGRRAISAAWKARGAKVKK